MSTDRLDMPSCLPTNGHDDVSALRRLLWGRNSHRAYLPDQVPATTIGIRQTDCVMVCQPWRANCRGERLRQALYYHAASKEKGDLIFRSR